jgi:hypothetical protein
MPDDQIAPLAACQLVSGLAKSKKISSSLSRESSDAARHWQAPWRDEAMIWRSSSFWPRSILLPGADRVQLPKPSRWTRALCRFGVAVVVVHACARSALAQSSSPKKTDGDAGRVFYDLGPTMRTMTHGDTAAWYAQRRGSPGVVDTVVYILHGDSVWRMRPEPRALMTPEMAAIVRQVMSANRAGMHFDSVFGRPTKP